MAADTSPIEAAPGGLTTTDRELFDRLAWFTHVRWAFGAFSLIALLVSWYALGLRLRMHDGTRSMFPAVRAVLIIFLYNALFVFLGRVLRARRQITRRLIESMALGQFFCDLGAIAALMHYTGGVENSFVVIILVPIAIVTELLPQGLAYATAAVAALLLNLLAWGEQQGVLPHVSVERAGGASIYADAARIHADPLHVFHVTGAITVTIFAIVFVASTIAARLRAREAELEGAHLRLRRADEVKGFFMRKAGHEMRAPLAAIHSILDAITQAPNRLSDEQQVLIGRARHRARAMIELVNDLLKVSRLRDGEEVLKAARVCLGRIVANTVELMRKRAEGAGLELRCAAGEVWLDGDEELLRELVTNLVANAVQYTPPGGRVEVALEETGGQAVLTVADTGIGIAPADRERIFEEFFRSTAAKETFQNGTGLGLAIVKRIVQVHRGEIRADARDGGGTVFTVRLPAGPPAAPPRT